MASTRSSTPSLNERAVDMMLFLLAQTITPTDRDWYAAVDDLFSELSEIDKLRMVDAGMGMLERRLQSTIVPQLLAA